MLLHRGVDSGGPKLVDEREEHERAFTRRSLSFQPIQVAAVPAPLVNRVSTNRP
jgi:hypothetical protein